MQMELDWIEKLNKSYYDGFMVIGGSQTADEVTLGIKCHQNVIY